MSISVNENSVNTYHRENFDETAQDPIEILPKKIILKIFSEMGLSTLSTICSLNKQWKQLENEPLLWKKAIYKEIAFGNDKWAEFFGENVVKDEDTSEEFSSLPVEEFITDCKKFKKIFPKKNLKDCLMVVRLPKTLNGGLTLNNLCNLAKKYFPNSLNGFAHLSSAIADQLGNKTIDKSCWVLMTKDVLPSSKNKNYSDQEKMIVNLTKESLANYEVPGALEVAACILSQYFHANTCLFTATSCTYTRCIDMIEEKSIVVGGFSEDCLIIKQFLGNVRGSDYHSSLGIAAMRKF